MADRLYLGRMQRRFYRHGLLLITIGIISLLGSAVVYVYMDLMELSQLLLSVGQVVIVVLISIAALSVIWRRPIVTALSVIGVLLVIGSVSFPVQSEIPSTYSKIDTSDTPNKGTVKHLVWRFEPAHALTPTGSAAMFFLGAGIIGVCMIIVYKPTLLYVKNRPSDDPPYPIWDSNYPYTTYKYRNVVPLTNLLATHERFVLSQYRYVHVRIGDKIYLVTPDSMVPDDSTVIRDADNKFFSGVSKTYG